MPSGAKELGNYLLIDVDQDGPGNACLSATRGKCGMEKEGGSVGDWRCSYYFS